MTSPASLSEPAEWEWEFICEYDGPAHTYPSDWRFGGAIGDDPRSDLRWMPTTYQYFDAMLELLHTTQTPLCDDQAIDEFTKVAAWFRNAKPKYLTVKRPGDDKFVMLPWEYDAATDTANEVRRG